MEMGIPEALWDLRTKEFGPLVVGIDTHGVSIYQVLRKKALEKLERDYPMR